MDHLRDARRHRHGRRPLGRRAARARLPRHHHRLPAVSRRPTGDGRAAAAAGRLSRVPIGSDLARGEPVTLQIAPSILSANFAELGRDIAAVERGGADLIHVDVMDGHFVPNITMGPPVVQAVKRVATRPLDVHLMIEQPDNYIEAFVKAGAYMISVHVEAVPHLHRTLAYIRSLGALARAAVQPSTPAS